MGERVIARTRIAMMFGAAHNFVAGSELLGDAEALCGSDALAPEIPLAHGELSMRQADSASARESFGSIGDPAALQGWPAFVFETSHLLHPETATVSCYQLQRGVPRATPAR
jgi:hypothetical protein